MSRVWTKLGIDGSVGLDPDGLGPVSQAIGLATESNSAFAVQYVLEATTRMGIDGAITVNEPNFEGKQQKLNFAAESSTAFPAIDFSVRAGEISQPISANIALPVNFQQTLAVTLVSSIRGTNIITANTELTVNVTNSTGVTQITVNGVQASLVTIITPTELTCQVPLGVGAEYSTNVDVIAINASGPSPAFSALWQPPLGMVETDFTVDYSGLDPDSPFSGDLSFSNIAIGDSCIYDAVTTPGGNAVAMNGLGEFVVSGAVSDTQTVNYYLYDASDQTVSASIEQLTIFAGPVEAGIGQASEADSTFTVSSLNVITGQTGRAQESDSAFAVVDGSPIFQFIGQAAEADASQPVSAQGPVQQVAIGLTTETDSSFPFTDESIPIGIINQINEVGFAFPVVDVGAVTRRITRATEVNFALDVDFPATLNSIRDQLEALDAQILALQSLINTQQGFIDELYLRWDLNNSDPNTYDELLGSIQNNTFTLTRIDNGDGTFTIQRS